MYPLRPQPITRIRICAPGGEEPRSHPKQPHPPSVVAAVRHLIETTRYSHRLIAERAGVNRGTVSRWRAKYGWKRPPGAWPPNPRPEQRYVPVLIGRALAQRLRIQAERLLTEIESAPAVDPAALAEALRLLAQSREQQRVRRGRRLKPPPPRPPEAIEAEIAAKKKRRQHDREAAALLGWQGRYSRRAQHQRWMLERE